MNKAYMIGEKNGQKYVAHTATRPPPGQRAGDHQGGVPSAPRRWHPELG